MKKYSKETKIKACKMYAEGFGGLRTIAEIIGCNRNSVHQWYLAYKHHGEKAFETANRRFTYTKDFKIMVADMYSSGKYSILDISSRFNIPDAVVRSWYFKYYNGIEFNELKGDHTMKSRKTTYEERVEIVEWTLSHDKDYSAASDKFGVSYALVYKWTKAYENEGSEALKYKKRGPKAKKDISWENLSEVERLKKELEFERELRKFREFELELLKKKEEIEKEMLSRK